MNVAAAQNHAKFFAGTIAAEFAPASTVAPIFGRHLGALRASYDTRDRNRRYDRDRGAWRNDGMSLADNLEWLSDPLGGLFHQRRSFFHASHDRGGRCFSHGEWVKVLGKKEVVVWLGTAVGF